MRTSSVVAARLPPALTSVTGVLVVGSLVSGVAGYLFQIVGARILGNEGFAPLGILWTLQYLVIAVALVPVETYLTRTTVLAAGDRDVVRAALRAALVWVVALAAVLGATVWALQDALLPGMPALVYTVPAGILTYGGFMALRGRLAGQERFRGYGAATLLEGVSRMALLLVAGLLVPTVLGLGWVLPLGPLLALLVPWDRVALRRSHRRALAAAPAAAVAGDVLASVAVQGGGRAAGRFLGWTSVANGLAQLLLLAGPLLLVPLGAGPSEVSVFFVTMTAARVPLVFAFNGLLSRVLPMMTRAARTSPRALSRASLQVVGVTFGLSVGGAAAGGLAGPWLLELFFGSGFAAPRWLAAAAAGGALLATGAQVLNQVLVAQQREKALVVPWGFGLVVCLLAVVALPGSASERVAAGFVVGHLAALLVLLVAARAAAVPSGAGERPRL